MKYTSLLLLLLLLGSCATQRQAEKYFEENPEKLAEFVDKNEAYTREYGKAYAAKHFPPRLYAPAVYTSSALTPGRLVPSPLLLPEAEVQRPRITASSCADCPAAVSIKTIFLQDTLLLDSLNRELKIEKLANTAIRQQLQSTEADRDYWREMNRKKRWALIAMAAFAILYILFKVLAARVPSPKE